MDISSFGNFNIFPIRGAKNAAPSSKYPNLAPLKKDTVSFSGNIQPKKEMSDAEFEELKSIIQSKIEDLDIEDRQKSRLSKLHLNKENIESVFELMENTDLLSNKRYITALSMVASSSCTKENSEARKILIEKVFSNPVLYENSDFMMNFRDLVSSADTPEVAEAKCRIIDKYLSYDGLLYADEEEAMFNLHWAAYTTTSKEASDLRCKFIDRVMNDEILSNSVPLLSSFGMFFGELHNEEQYNAQCMFLDKVKEYKELCRDEKFMGSVPYVSGEIMYEGSARAKCFLIDEFMAKDGLKEDPEYLDMLYLMLKDAYSMQIAELSSSMLDLCVDNKEIMKNKNASKFVMGKKNRIFGEIKENSYSFLNQLLKTKILFENDNIFKKVDTIFPKLAEKCPEITTFAFDKIAQSDKLKENPALLGCYLDSIFETEFVTNRDVPQSMEDFNARCKFFDGVISREDLPVSEAFYKSLSATTRNTNNEQEAVSRLSVLDSFLKNEGLKNSPHFCDNFCHMLYSVEDENSASIKRYVLEHLPKKEEFYKTDEIMSLLPRAISEVRTEGEARELIQLLNNEELPISQIAIVLNKENNISLKQLQHLNSVMGRNKVSKLSVKDIVVAANFADIYKKQNINEIPQAGKKELLKGLVSCNTGMFDISDTMKQSFPLIPTNQKEYCSLLPSIVRSLGIETKELSKSDIKTFNDSCNSLAGELKKLSDAEFNDLKITQKYSRKEFIEDVLHTVKGLSKEERNKVYDYFGFELHHKGKTSKEGFYMTGYPQNLNNGKKLAQITDENTKETVEKLRPFVIKFSENNHINCPQNKKIEQLLNAVADILPEIHPMVEKEQHGVQSFDVLKHSLKVMQKIAQSKEYDDLSDSDKKLMHIASLLHDITKQEGKVDHAHTINGAFDSYFICKKFNLTKDEEIKLYTLIKNHEWLKEVNTKEGAKQDRIMKSTAYEFRHDNMFDMALIFTHADLRSVFDNDIFHDTKEGKGRVEIDGIKRSFGECADIYGAKIKNYINELKKSQPLLPVTKLPSANRINEAVTVVRPDGSTNIKGVYKDKDGLIVLKYNEIEDFEAIGFEKGSTNKGYVDKTVQDDPFNTGNIKFFVHGLDYENQLAKFDAFSLIDSDALLSVSYAERPESKYRFFRPQGVILDVDTKYVHGGGETDAGSGCGKSIQEFKNNYIFGGYREADRLYVSNLIKETLGMSDSEYVDFVMQNENKSIIEIEPKEAREKLILAFGKINSRTRNGLRNYNEMYASNPKNPMGVFVYSIDYNEKIENPIDFLNRKTITKNESHGFAKSSPISVYDRTEFLRRYAIERNIPMVVFGD